MKFLKLILWSFILMSSSLIIYSCSNKGTQTEEQGKEYTSKYVCPMHCEGSGSDEPGKCPVCGMDYVLNDDLESDNSHDDHNHEGHNH